ncbi:DUF1593 domain-containing protein [Microbacterium murale]|uniref:DUF1593 domain-containing protein n=1 Tax=Microbacterium murale TaxID=1081040 RepID=A0ABU0PA56_9MICO|nr:DUF1593 domain-containing protein [Microbacterium murale]MDQ0644213.1 hypothetical protein [Microbacterium murale]
MAAFGLPRTIVTTDPEIDDANSLVRLLLYANEIEIQGLVYAGSQFHWRGDGRGTRFFHPDREYTEPQTSWRWGADDIFIHEVIDRYAEIDDNLRVHDARYPTAGHLRSLIRTGNVTFEGDDRTPSAGADLIVEKILDDDPRPLFVQLWAGPATLARALRTLEERFGSSPDWPAVRERLSRRVIVTKFASQDDTYEEYIAPSWPEVEVREVATRMWGYAARTVATAEGAHFLSSSWHEANIICAGPLGGHYRVWGDDRTMPGDHNDYFGTRRSEAELRADGYHVFTPVEEPGSWVSEGDTTNFLNLIGNGLRAFEAPHWGGWGGRQKRNRRRANEFLASLATDRDESDEPSTSYAAARWFPDAQRDFAARLRWSTTPEFAAANHAPDIRLVTPATLSARPGASVAVEADVSDPDGDETRLLWREDTNAADGAASGAFSHTGSASTEFTLAAALEPGREVHLILEARDIRADDQPSLARYARVVITIA